MHLANYNDVNIPLSMIVLSTISFSRATAVSEGHKVTSILITFEIMSKVLML